MKTVPCENAPAVVEEMVWLAWNASRVVGMGIYQDNPDATRDDVVNPRITMSDGMNKAYCDYVFGRMMKLYIEFTNDTISLRDDVLNSEYQSWCQCYPTYEILMLTAIENLKNK